MRHGLGLCPSRNIPTYVSMTSSLSSVSSSASSIFSFDSKSSSQSSASSLGSISEHDSFLGPQKLTSAVVDRLVVSCEKSLYESEQATRQEDVIVVPQDQRQNPRRCGRIGEAHLPSLVRQGERKLHFVDNLVDSAAQIVEAIWPLSKVACRGDAAMGNKGVLPLRRFIEETLRRSRTSYSTLQVALYYLIIIRPHVPKNDFTMEQTEETHALRALMCGRRMFLAALILASKYLQDKNYSAKAWSKLSGLPITEINSNEMIFLSSVNWKLHISEKTFQRWSDIVLKYTPTQPPSSPHGTPVLVENSWTAVIGKLNRELDHPEILMAIRRTSPTLLPYELPRLSTGVPPLGLGCLPPVMEPMPQPMTPISMRRSPNLLFTPPSTGFCTPAVSVMSMCEPVRRPSIGGAMAQAQNACTARTTVDKFCFGRPNTMGIANVISPPNQPSSWSVPRRSSLATTCSVSSSPESMVSDTSSQSSRSSRSSSISSVSSSLCPPVNASLAMQATCRSAKLLQQGVRQPVMIISEDYDRSDMEYSASPDSYTADFNNFSLNTPCLTSTPKETNTVRVSARSQEYTPISPLSPTASPHKSRKRGRTVSTDDLQCHVRQLMARDLLSISAARTESRLSGLQMPLQKDMGRKRACCADEAIPAPFMMKGANQWEQL